MRRVVVDRDSPQHDAIEEAAMWIRRGGVVAVPTDTLYGLAADPFNAAAVARVFAVKGRSAERALPLIAADTAQIAAHLGVLTPVMQRVADRFWPGPLTLLLPAAPALAADVTAGTGRVGVRVPSDAIARAIAAAAGKPITATSANPSGEPATRDPDRVERTLGTRIDLLIDTGMTPGGAPSTILDLLGDTPVVVREGAISRTEIDAWLQHA